MKELSGAIKQGLDISDMLSGDYPADYIYQKKQEQIEQELDFNSAFSRNENNLHEKKESDDMNKHTKTLFGPATERKPAFEEQIKNAEFKRDQQILNYRKTKAKEQEQAVI